MLDGISFDPVTGRLHDHSAETAGDIARHPQSQSRGYLSCLQPVEARVLRWLVGISEASLSVEEIAERMNMGVDQVWRVADRGLAAVGLYALGESTILIEEAA